ncbi:DUF2922 domain-containing protein [Clostridium beijerinckii]|uniref:DUF2922 domain-containing protein n=1 Tax=Clostridium beijerinckii TaxID=1520 RepID=A0AAE5H9K7_CLOBE|nr:DUF2922 domain-containing protein [Clostridium beijerinckii]NSB16541.1 hypothetical protein [Clostridium beijerinckii]OOM29390.1 hypothetical protein CLOBE_21670 [Clostridium beijerinckii]
MEYVLALTFITENGLKSNFSISGVKPDVTPAQVNSLMDTIIQKNVFFSSSGALVKKSDAKLTEKTVTKIDVA